jgi:hypothetical protein
MTPVSSYVTYRQVADDLRCQEIMKWAAADAETSMSGEEFLDIAAKVIAVPLPLGAIGNGAARAYGALGVHTSKTQAHRLEQAFGYSILGTLCFLGSKAMPIADVADAEGHCLVQAILPSSALSWKGRVMVSIQAVEGGSLVEASTKIPGQLMDWGRSTRLLRDLFDDIDRRSAGYRSKGL